METPDTGTRNTHMPQRPLLAITMGDAAGIGPEVTAKALQDEWVYQHTRPLVVGSAAAMADALAGSIESPIARFGSVRSVEDAGDGVFGAIDVLDLDNLDYSGIGYGASASAEAGRASIEWVLRSRRGSRARGKRGGDRDRPHQQGGLQPWQGTKTSATWRYFRGRPAQSIGGHHADGRGRFEWSTSPPTARCASPATT